MAREEISERARDSAKNSTIYKNLDPAGQDIFVSGLTTIIMRYVRSRKTEMRKGMRIVLGDAEESRMFTLLERVGKPHSAVKGVEKVVGNVIQQLLHPGVFTDAHTTQRIHERSIHTDSRAIRSGRQRHTNEVAPPNQRHSMPGKNRSG